VTETPSASVIIVDTMTVTPSSVSAAMSSVCFFLVCHYLSWICSQTFSSIQSVLGLTHHRQHLIRPRLHRPPLLKKLTKAHPHPPHGHQVRTVTVTPTTPPDSLNITGAATKKSSSSGLSTGGAVGLTVGLVALVALICSIIYFCIRKRRKEKARAAADDINSRRGSSAGLGGHIPSRTMSENSRYVLGTDGRQVVETWEPETRDAPGSRRSRLMPVDPRLDPFAPVYQRGENKSRESVNTIRDDHDYSRRVHQQGPILRATNPDE